MKPKQVLCLIVLLLFTAVFVSCKGNTKASTSVSINNTETTNVVEIVESGPHFMVYQKEFLFYYEIFNQNGDAIVSSDMKPQYPDIEMIDDVVIRITTQGGTGTGTQTSYFCNVNTGARSEDFSCVLAQYKNLVVYAQSDKIIATSIFDHSFYREIKHFQYPFSPSAFPFEGAEFIEDGTGVRITYLTGNDYETVSEEFILVE